MSGLVTAQNKEHWNNKLEKLLEEKKELELKKENLKNIITGMEKDLFSDADYLTNQLKTFNEALKNNPDDPDKQRTAILANIKEIGKTKDGRYYLRLNYGTSKGQDWLRHLDSNQGPSG